MSTYTHLRNRYLLMPLILFGAISAHADTAKGCIELKSDAQMEQEYVDANGQKATRLVPPAKVIPGNEVIYTVTAINTCNKPVDNVVINNPVPEHMTYVVNSAMGVGTDISYSLNGKDFNKAEALTVKDAEGKSRAARSEEINSIRWLYSSAFQPGATGFVRFRATVN